MGIKQLNHFLMENCTTNAIYKTSLKQFTNKTIVIDTSIYLYKFAEKNAVAENIYLMISVFRQYNIVPVFVFDGKPPAEKKALLIRRKIEKDTAEAKYNELKTVIENIDVEPVISDSSATKEALLLDPGTTKEALLLDPSTTKEALLLDPGTTKEALLLEMEKLKKQFIRVTESDITKSKEIMKAYGVPYIESRGESDHLCAFLVKHGFAWACLSDDMDMFLYGCPRVIRHLSLLNHEGVYYDTMQILNDLDMTQDVFNDIAILSGTDYNLSDQKSLSDTVRLYMRYREWANFNSLRRNAIIKTFYDWLIESTDYIDDLDSLKRIRVLFDLNVFLETHKEEFKDVVDTMPFQLRNVNMEELMYVLDEDGFIFA
jgi:5'-3' exonuclease